MSALERDAQDAALGLGHRQWDLLMALALVPEGKSSTMPNLPVPEQVRSPGWWDTNSSQAMRVLCRRGLVEREDGEHWRARILTKTTAFRLSDLGRALFRERVVSWRPTILGIQRAVGRHYGYTALDIQSARQGRELCLARDTALHLARTLTFQTMPTIAKAFGDRDLKTVKNSLGRVRKRMGAESRYAVEVRMLAVHCAVDCGSPPLMASDRPRRLPPDPHHPPRGGGRSGRSAGMPREHAGRAARAGRSAGAVDRRPRGRRRRPGGRGMSLGQKIANTGTSFCLEAQNGNVSENFLDCLFHAIATYHDQAVEAGLDDACIATLQGAADVVVAMQQANWWTKEACILVGCWLLEAGEYLAEREAGTAAPQEGSGGVVVPFRPPGTGPDGGDGA